MEELPDPWIGDLFNRRQEAALLLGYIESIVGSETVREDTRAHTIAVDAGYGEGKTFFLKRFAKQISETHPVAFVDAWADDLADEPLTAIAATLQTAFDPIISKSESVRDKWNAVLQKTGKVAKIVAVGLLKRGLSVAIGTTAVEGVETVVSGVAQDAADALKDGAKDAAEHSVETALKSWTSVAPNKLMRDRIDAFQKGQAAIAELKASLESLVRALDEEALKAPIVIIIDELDRCRPTYAIKLLEEIKHLFDVPGLVFIFGTHTEQLAHSVSGAYGVKFDGRAYLRRFINRQYKLAEPNLEPLLTKLLNATQLGDRLVYPRVLAANEPAIQLPAGKMIAHYMRSKPGMRSRLSIYCKLLLHWRKVSACIWATYCR
jgi:KAP-like P-loop domain-containing protein